MPAAQRRCAAAAKLAPVGARQGRAVAAPAGGGEALGVGLRADRAGAARGLQRGGGRGEGGEARRRRTGQGKAIRIEGLPGKQRFGHSLAAPRGAANGGWRARPFAPIVPPHPRPRSPRRCASSPARSPPPSPSLPTAAVPALPTGARAPDFTTRRRACRPARSSLNLREQLRNGPVVLYFYPQAFTGGCTLEAHAFSEAARDFRRAGARVIGMSADDYDTLRRFSVEGCRSAFPVATASRATIRAYDVALERRHAAQQPHLLCDRARTAGSSTPIATSTGATM